MDNSGSGPAIGVALMMYFMFACYGAFIMFMIGSVVVWVLALVDVVKREFKDPNDKLIWVLVVCLTQFIGGLIYIAVGRKKGWLPGETAPPPHEPQ